MRESVTYQAIVEEGRLEATRDMLLDLGSEQLGQPSEDIKRAIRDITDRDRLRRLVRRVLKVSNWQELLAAT
jgi:hypothetical protein